MNAAPPRNATARPRVVVIGCGFGGLEAARRLARAEVELTVVDRTNHHLFQPLLYQVATADVAAPAVAGPIRHILRRQIRRGHTTVLRADVRRIDAGAKRVVLDDGSALAYDHLIVAAGASHSYFGREEWAPYAPGLKTLADAFDIRARIVGAFEQAERCGDDAECEKWLSFAIVGAGATGVELAGALAEIARRTLPGEFHRIDPRRARVVLIEGGDRVLPAFHPRLSARARRQLEALGVEVRLQSRVVEIDRDGVDVAQTDGTQQRFAARTVLWAAGVAASPLARSLAETAGAELDRAGRVVVEPDLALAGHPEISVIGDLAAATTPTPRGPKPVPGVSPAAKQMGRAAARNVVRRLQGSTALPFRYRDYGSLATIGRNSAVVQLEVGRWGELRWSGWPAWVFWLFAHIYFLIGFRNRLVVLIDWAWSYWTFARHARVVA